MIFLHKITKLSTKIIFGSKVMKVLVKSWKNATEQHDQGSKTNENACIKYEFAFVCWNLYYIISGDLSL